MTGGKSTAGSRAGLSRVLDELEFHRALDVQLRLDRAVVVQREASELGSTSLAMRARLVEADMRLRLGDVTAAAHLATEVNNWARAHRARPLLARSHLVLSSIFESVGDAASCLDHAVSALEHLGPDASPRTRGNFLVELGDALSVNGSFDAARERYREAEAVFLEIGDLERRMTVINNLAYTEFEAGEPLRMWQVAQELLDLAAANGFALSPPFLDTMARAYMGIGDYDRAAATLESAVESFATRGDTEADTPAGIMLTLAEVQRLQDRLDAAQETLEACRSIAAQRRLGAVEVDVLEAQADLYAATGHFDKAYELHKMFHAQFLSLSSSRREANARTRQALFETSEARHQAKRFWRQARTDALTGLPNRRFVNEELPRLLGEAETGSPLAVAIVDADHFKRVNDTLSHEVGDQAIAELARVLEEALPATSEQAGRVSRFVARIGGEEFLVVLPGTDLGRAEIVLKAIRDAVAGHDWRPLLGDMRLTVSIGACAAMKRDTQSTLLARADHNLYAAKAAGRNRVVLDDLPAVIAQLHAVSGGKTYVESAARVAGRH
jgi:diguanylate cyclase (GGDEF)-like protein